MTLNCSLRCTIILHVEHMALELSRTVQTIFPYISMVVIALLVACLLVVLELSLIIIMLYNSMFWEYNILASMATKRRIQNAED